MSIETIRGDLLSTSCVIRCHQVNCRGVMGRGIAKQIHEKYPEAFTPYKALCKQFGGKLLGEVQFIPCHDGTIIANLFAQDDYGTDRVQTDMPALEECLSKVSLFAAKTGASVGFPKYMGAALAGGNWEKIYALIQAYFTNPAYRCIIVDWDKNGQSSTTSGPTPQITLYTDGSCIGNPGPGGWACILKDNNGHEKELVGGSEETTNNRMELLAVIEGLKALKRPSEVHVFSDSSYLVNSVKQGWLAAWKAAGWKKKEGTLKNVDLLKALDEQLARHKVSFTWVKGHAENPYNNRCDELANSYARKLG